MNSRTASWAPLLKLVNWIPCRVSVAHITTGFRLDYERAFSKGIRLFVGDYGFVDGTPRHLRMIAEGILSGSMRRRRSTQ
jgi:hypothetical protein